ncbi:MAG TPA: MFS transporter [Chthoniobacter sp.]|jgi:MFS family permease
MTQSTAPKLTIQSWLIIIIASIGFLFDTYQLLMTPLAGPQALSELLKVPLSNPAISEWAGKLLWLSALSGGIFGLLGGWLIDRLGRKSVMAIGIFIYSLSPVAGAFATTVNGFIFWRCVTFVGVCIEFVAAITWMAEVFSDKVQRERWLGITQAFASLGGIIVAWVNVWIIQHSKGLPHLGMPLTLGSPDPASWRYLMLTGIIPAIPIALLLPFVPESKIWREKKDAGTLKRPSFGELFSPQLRRVTLVTAGLSACAYGVAFGCLQQTPLRIVPGLPDLAHVRAQLKPLQIEAKQLNIELDKTQPGTPERAKAIAPIKANALKLKPLQDEVKKIGSETQEYQEVGGLLGRIFVALLIFMAVSRRAILRFLQFPGLVVVPLAYLLLYHKDATTFTWGIAAVGFVTTSQFSFLGEILPKVFPLHLRGTGGSFATNVGGRMIGTGAAFLTPTIAKMFGGSSFDQMAVAAGWLGLAIVIFSIFLATGLPEPKGENLD